MFVEFERLLIDHMIMSLSKLTDKAKTSRNSNLSFYYLIENINPSAHEKLSKQVLDNLEMLKESCTKFRKIRNKRVAHNDLPTYLNIERTSLPGIKREDIETALQLSRSIMNMIQLHFHGSQTFYEEVILPYGNDGNSLMVWLQKGLKYQQLENDGVVPRRSWRDISAVDS